MYFLAFSRITSVTIPCHRGGEYVVGMAERGALWRNRGLLDGEGAKRRLKVWLQWLSWLQQLSPSFRKGALDGGGDLRGRALGGRV